MRSPSDKLKTIQNKMQEYLDNGAKLGWLIDPQCQVLEIYRPSQQVEILQSPNTVSGGNTLSGFSLDLAEILN